MQDHLCEYSFGFCLDDMARVVLKDNAFINDNPKQELFKDNVVRGLRYFFSKIWEDEREVKAWSFALDPTQTVPQFPNSSQRVTREQTLSWAILQRQSTRVITPAEAEDD